MIGGCELDSPQPFRAFPEIKVRHDKAHRAAMLGRQRRALPAIGEQCVLAEEIGQSEISGVAIVAGQDGTHTDTDGLRPIQLRGAA